MIETMRHPHVVSFWRLTRREYSPIHASNAKHMTADRPASTRRGPNSRNAADSCVYRVVPKPQQKTNILLCAFTVHTSHSVQCALHTWHTAHTLHEHKSNRPLFCCGQNKKDSNAVKTAKTINKLAASNKMRAVGREP